MQSAGKGSSPERSVAWTALTALAATTAAIVQAAGGGEATEVAWVRALAWLGSPVVAVVKVSEAGRDGARSDVAASVAHAGFFASGGRGGFSAADASTCRDACTAAAVASIGTVGSIGGLRSTSDRGIATRGVAGAAAGFGVHAVDEADRVDPIRGTDSAALAEGVASIGSTGAVRVADFDSFFVIADDHCPDRHAAASGLFLPSVDRAGRAPPESSRRARAEFHA